MPRDDVERFFPLRALQAALDPEAAQLGLRAGFARAELDAPTRDQVEHRDPLGNARWVVEVRRKLHDAVAEPDLLRALAGGGQKDLRRRAVAVLLEEVVLDLPHAVPAEPIGQLDLLQRVVQQLLFRALGMRSRQLVFVEQPEAHRGRIVHNALAWP